jgi:predicted RecB family nuclease
MIYQSINKHEANNARMRIDFLIKQGKSFELKEKKLTRSGKQNSALHLFFTMVADQLNDSGAEFQDAGLSTGQISTIYTCNIVKELIWRPLQTALFDVKSTTELTTCQIDRILDIIIKFFGERGLELDFPRKKLTEHAKP